MYVFDRKKLISIFGIPYFPVLPIGRGRIGGGGGGGGDGGGGLGKVWEVEGGGVLRWEHVSWL